MLEETPETVAPPTPPARTKDEIALELTKFIAATTGYGKGGTTGAGFSGEPVCRRIRRSAAGTVRTLPDGGEQVACRYFLPFLAAFLAGAFLAGAFLKAALAGAFLAAVFLAGAFLATTFLAGTFFAGAFLAGSFLAGAFTAAFFAGGAFFTAAFLAGAFFAGTALAAVWQELSPPPSSPRAS